MKRIYLIFFLVFLMTAAGCKDRPREISSSTDTVSKTENSNSIYNSSTEISGAEAQEAENYKGSLISENSSVTQSSEQSENKRPQTEAPNNAPKVENPASESIQNAESSASESETPATPPKPAVKDEIWIANRVFELLNEERKAAGVHTREMLTGLNRIAGLRSEQLVTQFSHMYKDENGRSWIGADFAATKFKYGEYFDWNEAGCPELADQNYYTYSGAENCCGGGGCTNEEIAQSIINSFKKSPGHWASLMSEDLYYDGIGVTFGVNPEYPEVECWCSVNSSAENYG